MADSIPSLRRLVNELRAEVRELKSRPAEVVEKVLVREVPVDVVREIKIPVIEYVEKVVNRPIIQYIENPAPPREVITKLVEIEVPVEKLRIVPVYLDRPVYQDNPDHIETIRKLQEKLCQFTSQLDS